MLVYSPAVLAQVEPVAPQARAELLGDSLPVRDGSAAAALLPEEVFALADSAALPAGSAAALADY